MKPKKAAVLWHAIDSLLLISTSTFILLLIWTILQLRIEELFVWLSQLNIQIFFFLLIIIPLMIAWHSSKNIISMWQSIFLFPRHWGLVVNVFLCSCITLIIAWSLDLIKYKNVWLIVYEIAIILFCVGIAKIHLFLQKKYEAVIRDPKQDDRPINILKENTIQDFEDIARKILKNLQTNNENDNHGPNVALIGPFGSGKTSLCNLIEDIYKNHNNDLKVTKIIFCRFEAWQYLTADAAVRGLLDQIVSKIQEHVDSFQLNSIPEKYLDALGACPHWIFRVFSIVLKRKNSTEEIVQILQNILLRINQKVVVFVDDLDRLENHSPQAQDAVAAALNQLQNLTNVQYVLCVGPSVTLDKEGSPRKCNYDLLKATRLQEIVPSLQGKEIIERIKALRDEAISSDENMVYIWYEGETHDPLKYNPMIDYLSSDLASKIIRMIQTPRQLKTVERETREKWNSLKGEISWYDLLMINIIKACELPIFEWIINNPDQFLVGSLEFFDKNKEDKKKELLESIEGTLKERLSVKTDDRFKLVRQVLNDLFPYFIGELGGLATYMARNEPQAWEQRLCFNLLEGVSYFERYKSGRIPQDIVSDQYILQYIKKIEKGGFQRKEFEEKFLDSLEKLTNDINRFKQFNAILSRDIAIEICDCILDWICNREHWKVWDPIYEYPSSVMSNIKEILDKAGAFHRQQLWKRNGFSPEKDKRLDEWITIKLKVLLEKDLIVAYYFIHGIAKEHLDENIINEIAGNIAKTRFLGSSNSLWDQIKGSIWYLSYVLKMLKANKDYSLIRDDVTNIIIKKVQSDDNNEELKSSIIISLICQGNRPDSDNPSGIFVNKENNKIVYNMSILLPLVASWKENDFNDPEVKDACKRLLKAYEDEINNG
jgi:energy-coupling factor transporter ATP-binding protein EcfA2